MRMAAVFVTLCFAGMVVCTIGLLLEAEAAVVFGGALTLPLTAYLGVVMLAAVIGQPLACLLRLASRWRGRRPS